MKRFLHPTILAALITAAATLAATVAASLLSPAISELLGHRASTALRADLEKCKADYERELEQKATMTPRKISYEVALLDVKVKTASADGVKPSVDILGINALGQIHQGYKSLLECLRNGGKIRVLLLDPECDAFRKRAQDERDVVGRIAAELNAALYGWLDVIAQLKSTHPQHVQNLQLRLHTNYPDRALWVLNRGQDGAVVIKNRYPDPPGRGLEGGAYTWYYPKNKPDFDDEVKYFDKLWASAEPVELGEPAHYPWPYVRPTVGAQRSTAEKGVQPTGATAPAADTQR